MAEQEVIKHTKKIFTLWGGGKKSFWHKLGEFVLEIIIIVFAVSLSIYLHDISEKKHQDQETKEFLLGLRQDLKLDIDEIKQDKEAFLSTMHAFYYFKSLGRNEMPVQDSINKHYSWLISLTSLIPNNGRFEGFKSSGKINTIENKELQNTIMDLYQECIPTLIASTNAYNSRKQKLFDFITQNRKRTSDSTSNLKALLVSDNVYYYCVNLLQFDEIFPRYDACLDKMKIIIREIDREYGQNHK